MLSSIATKPIPSEAAQKQQEQLARNLGTLYKGMNGTGHKDMPKPLEEKK